MLHAIPPASTLEVAILPLLLACNAPRFDVCDCPAEVVGHAVMIEDTCSCLPSLPATPLPETFTEFDLSGGSEPDWDAIDAALVDTDVVVRFAPGDRWERLRVLRSDTGPHRLVLDGGDHTGRAVVEGILTPFDEGAKHRVTVRGFEITDSRDKGIYWEAGDDVLIEDVVIHDVRGTPSLNLQYSNRTGLPSRGFTVRNIHMYNQRGECLYIGGSEGEDLDSHTDVVVENNLVHDCYASNDTKHDAINVKDRLSNVVVRRNVVLHADWGIEVASSGMYSHNLAIDIDREAFQVSDAFSPLADMAFLDNVAIRPGHDGFHFASEQAPVVGMTLERATVIGAEKAGVLVASDFDVQLEMIDVVVVDSKAGFDGWGPSQVTLQGCAVGGNQADFERSLDAMGPCDTVEVPDVTEIAGADGLFFTEDDSWLMPGGAQLPVD